MLIFIESRGLANEQNLGLRRTFAWYRLIAGLGQGASGAPRDFAGNLLQLRAGVSSVLDPRPPLSLGL